jgi:hypothetical protein
MKQVSVITTGLWAKVQTGEFIPVGEIVTPRVQEDLNRQTATVINGLFRELRSIFPAWKQAWPDMATYKSAKQQWMQGFLEARIRSKEQLQFGLMRARQAAKDFVPNVGRFIEWCTPTAEMLGLPTLAAAHREAIRNAHPGMAGQGKWTHDAVWHTAKECGFESLNKLETALSLKLFERNYAITVRRLLAGLPLQSMPLALPNRIEARSAATFGNNALAELRALRAGGVRG